MMTWHGKTERDHLVCNALGRTRNDFLSIHSAVLSRALRTWTMTISTNEWTHRVNSSKAQQYEIVLDQAHEISPSHCTDHTIEL